MASLNTPELQIRETMLERVQSLSAVSSPFLVPQGRYRNEGQGNYGSAPCIWKSEN